MRKMLFTTLAAGLCSFVFAGVYPAKIFFNNRVPQGGMSIPVRNWADNANPFEQINGKALQKQQNTGSQ